MLPVMLQAAEIIIQHIPQVQFVLPQADTVSDELINGYLGRSKCQIRLIKSQPYDVIQCCDVVMTTSGTATLETALLSVPMVIAYRLSPLTYWLGRLLVKTPFIGLPNIVAGKSIVKELIQHDATPEKLGSEVIRILSDKAYAGEMRAALFRVKEQLGHSGGSKKMADLAFSMLRD